MLKARFTDWNSLLGTLLLTAIMLGVTIGSILAPESYFEDSRIMARMLPFVGPIVAAAALYRLVIYVEFGPKIAFRRIFGRREYDWNQLIGIELRKMPKRYFFGLIELRNDYLIFGLLGNDGHLKEHAYRLTDKNRDTIAMLIQARTQKPAGKTGR